MNGFCLINFYWPIQFFGVSRALQSFLDMSGNSLNKHVLTMRKAVLFFISGQRCQTAAAIDNRPKVNNG